MNTFLRSVGTLAGWGIGVVAAYAIFFNISEPTAFWCGIAIVALGLNYELQTIKDKLDAIQSDLQQFGDAVEYPRGSVDYLSASNS